MGEEPLSPIKPQSLWGVTLMSSHGVAPPGTTSSPTGHQPHSSHNPLAPPHSALCADLRSAYRCKPALECLGNGEGFASHSKVTPSPNTTKPPIRSSREFLRVGPCRIQYGR